MSERANAPSPELEAPVPLEARPSPIAIASLGALVCAVGAGIWMTGAFDGPLARYIPREPADLAATLITPISPNDGAAIRAAIQHMQVNPHERLRLEAGLREGSHRIAWIVFIDSIDPDGDVIAVEAGGTNQIVTLSKNWTPVPVPLTAAGDNVTVTAVRDGISGGVTVALATRGGPVTLRTLRPGERVVVAQ